MVGEKATGCPPIYVLSAWQMDGIVFLVGHIYIYVYIYPKDVTKILCYNGFTF
ncbi:MAG: hypothetical protein ACI90V_002108 [Bacillariaceae sp.]|jgi:hypothetical protein